MPQRSHMKIIFLDILKAFDQLNRSILLKRLWHYNFPLRLIYTIMDILTNTMVQVQQGKNLKPLNVETFTGSPQGSPLSPLLFILFINPLVEELNDMNGVEALFYADDATIIAESEPIALRAL